MRILLTVFLLLISSVTFGQKKNKIEHNEKIVGKNLFDSTEIKGTEYIFPERIHETYLDTTNGFLTVQLRGIKKEKWLSNRGNILQYDLNNKSLLWSKKIVYETNTLQQFSNTMIFTVAKKSNCLDIKSGDEIWEVKNNIYYVDPVENIGIGYRFNNSTSYSNELEGIDLKNGNIIWKRFINREYGWNDVFYTNDSTMIVVAAGLHSININNGRGWDYHTKTGKKVYTGMIAANAVGVAAGLMTGTGTFITPTGYSLVRDVVSNSLVDSSYIYFASKEQLSKINKETGEIAWNHLLPYDLASKSTIFMNDNVIYMVNKGYAFMGSRKLDFGKPFIAAFDRETGKQKYLTLINVRKDPILDFKILQNEIYLVFKNRIAKYSMITGNLIIEKEFHEDRYGDLKYFVGNRTFVRNENNNLVSLPHLDPSKTFVFTNQRKTLSVDDYLSVVDMINYEDLSIYYLHTADLKFIAKDKQTLIVDNKGKEIAEIEASSKAFLIGTTLYDKQDKSFIAIDLKEILSKNKSSTPVE
ncbi:outer membrane protein assembly factor BamB family protein [Flammeovirga aprica]|uniref:PQQ-binding-like beta-propeller repeat protein n=1 Tax=Flammeovirga aprica JL-4 TaxID=694437 RepID=A0A7X9RUZ0_9BACT|nr:PQQ-binding-like beta-propeller repeat protein [Flammeovirga aprica]NME69181.1 PQQ-binding-like beta-propeller repeat protein [Flammeovirga aprica JL-4]